MKRVVAIVLALVVCLCGAFALADSDFGIEDVHFDTPEAAIEQLIAAIAENDLQKALETSIATYIRDGFDFRAYSEYVRSITPIENGYAPADYNIYKGVNELHVISDFVDELICVYSSHLPREERSGPFTTNEDKRVVIDYVRRVDPSQYANLTIDRIDTPNFDADRSEEIQQRLQENRDNNARLFGADEKVDRVALLDLNGMKLYAGFTMLRYGDDWRVDSMLSTSQGRVGGFFEMPIDIYESILP